MSRAWRATIYLLIGVAITVLILVATLLFLTRTRTGVSLVGRIAIEKLEDEIEGRLALDSVTTRGLLGGATLHGISLTDLEGRPFVEADSLRIGYRIRSFLAGEIVFNRAVLYRPTVTIEQLPGDTLWNFEHIFPPGPPEPDKERSLIEIDRIRVIDGTAIVRTPLEPGLDRETAEGQRLIVREVPGGLVRELRFDRIDATLPRIIWETPAEPGRLIEIDALAARGFVWDDPFIIDKLRGALTIRDSLITFDIPAFAMPGSRGSAIGEIIAAGESISYDVRVSADHVAFTDLGWLYPPLAIEGGGTGTFRMQTQPVGTLFLVQDAQIRAPGTNLSGSFGIVVDDTLYFTQVALRASPLNLGLLHEIIPDAPVLEGLLAGTVEVDGPISALTTSGSLGLVDRRGRRGRDGIRWEGTLDLDGRYGATALVVDIDEFDLALLRQLWPDPELVGTISGHLETTGELERGMSLQTEIRYRGRDGEESRLSGGGTFALLGGQPTVDLDLNAHPLDLRGLSDLVPALNDFEGEVRGRIAARGGIEDLDLSADLLAQDGHLQLQGNLALAGDNPRYRVEGSLDHLLLDRLLTGRIPGETSLNARFALDGEGFDPRTARAGLILQVDSAQFARIELSSAALGLRIEDGIAHLDSLVAIAAIGALRAEGTLGLDTGRTGSIDLLINADSLAALQSFFFPDAPILLDPDSVRGRIGGGVRVEAKLHGALGALEADGSARIRRPAVEGVAAQQVAIDFTASGIGSDSLLAYHLTAAFDSLDIYGHKLDRALAIVDYNYGGGWFQLEAEATEPLASDYHLISGFRPLPGGIELDLRELRAHTGSEEWGLAEPTRLRLGTEGLEIEGLLFSRTTGAGRVLARGKIPWRGEAELEGDLAGTERANLQLEFQQLPLFSLRTGEEDYGMGIADITGSATVRGTALAPIISVELALTDARVSGLSFEKILASIEYDDQRLDLTLEASKSGYEVLTGSGSIPLDLRLMSVPERRLAEPLDLHLRAAGVPAAILTSFLEGVRAIEGEIDGIIRFGGTTLDPVLGGQLSIRDGAATWAESGIRYRGISGTAVVDRDQLVEVSLTARTTGGSATLGGRLDFEELTNPSFELLILARNFQAVQRRDIEMTASGEIRLQGTLNRPEIQGKVRVDKGTLYLDEVMRQYQIVTLDDPLLLDIVDTTFVIDENILAEAQSEFVKNMKVSAEIEIQRGSWLRSRQLNVEVSGGLRVEFNRSTEDIRLTGNLNAIRGTYEFYVAEDLPARRFVVRGGTVEFDGTPGVNPGFDITAAYRVRSAERQALNILAHLTGTLESPRVNLRTDDDDTIGESDLLSYLIFGRPSYALAGGEVHQLDSYLTGLGAGIVTPTLLGYWAMLSETIATNLGIADYVSITPTEADTLGFGDGGLRDFVDPFSALGRSQVEVGKYLGDEWYMAATRRFGQGVKPFDFGVRFEWRIAPTWTAEIFVEDRFARSGRFGFDQPLESRKIGGLFLFREWGF